MPSALNTRIRLLETEIQLFGNDLYTLYQHTYNCAVQLNVEGNPNSSTQMYGMANDLYYMFGHWSGTSSDIKYLLTWCLDYINDNAFNGVPPDPYVLTMDKILNVIWESDKLRWFHFINYIDSMRAGIWNTEIYEKHLEDWYRHFSTA